MTEAPTSRESFELAFQDYLEESRLQQASRFGPDMLAWLALPPQWTGRLARQAGFPGWDPEFLEAAANEGLCARTQASLADQPPWYAVEVGARLAAYLPADSLTGLLEEVAAIGDQHAQARILATMTRSLPPSLLARATQIAELAARSGRPDPGPARRLSRRAARPGGGDRPPRAQRGGPADRSG